MGDKLKFVGLSAPRAPPPFITRSTGSVTIVVSPGVVASARGQRCIPRPLALTAQESINQSRRKRVTATGRSRSFRGWRLIEFAVRVTNAPPLLVAVRRYAAPATGQNLGTQPRRADHAAKVSTSSFSAARLVLRLRNRGPPLSSYRSAHRQRAPTAD